jgi:Ca2+-binding EF-hand superfamily protein
MSRESNRLSENEIKEIFKKYDTNEDNQIDKNELTLMVTDIYKKTHKTEDLSEKDKIVINKSVEKLINVKDSNKDGTLQLEEFISYYNGENIVKSTGKIDVCFF